jgi:hypothetical protein
MRTDKHKDKPQTTNRKLQTANRKPQTANRKHKKQKREEGDEKKKKEDVDEREAGLHSTRDFTCLNTTSAGQYRTW